MDDFRAGWDRDRMLMIVGGIQLIFIGMVGE